MAEGGLSNRLARRERGSNMHRAISRERRGDTTKGIRRGLFADILKGAEWAEGVAAPVRTTVEFYRGGKG